MKLTLLADEGDLLRVQCSGDVTSTDVPAGHQPLEPFLGPKGFTRKVLLNLAQVTFIDSSGVGWLINTHKKFSDNGGLIVLYSIPKPIRHVLQLVRMESVLKMADDEAAAVRLARSP